MDGIRMKRMMEMALVASLLGACSPTSFEMTESPILVATESTAAADAAATTIEPRQPRSTQVRIDGDGSDWDDYHVLAVDAQGDHREGTPDLAEVSLFANNEFLYVMVSLYEEGEFDHLIIAGEAADGSAFQLGVNPLTGGAQFAIVGEPFRTISIEGAGGEVLEFKVELAELGIDLTRVTALESCCLPGNVRGDTLEIGQALEVVFEVEQYGISASKDPTAEPSSELPPELIGINVDRRQIFAQSLQGILSIAISPSGRIVMTDRSHSGLLELHEDGSLSEYAPRVARRQFGIAFDDQGNLYVATGSRSLWKVSPDGTSTMIATDIHILDLDIAPSGEIFSVGPDTTDILRIAPDGEVSVYATGFSALSDIAVSPATGEVYVAEKWTGEIKRVDENGNSTTILDLQPEGRIEFAEDGTLYHSGHEGVSIISMKDGRRTPLEWANEIFCMHHSGVAFDNQNRILIIEYAGNSLGRYDPRTGTGEVLYQGFSTSRALGVTPNDGGVYLGVTPTLCNGPGMIFRIVQGESPAIIADNLPTPVNSITVDAEGLGYVSAGNAIFTFSADGIIQLAATYEQHTESLAIDPLTGDLWGAGTESLWHASEIGEPTTFPYPADFGVPSLAFTPDGTLYLFSVTSDETLAPVDQGIYRFGPTDSSFTQIADLSTVNMCCIIGSIGASQDGNIYWVGWGDRYTLENQPDMHMLQITPLGEVTYFGRHLPVDPVVIAGSPDSNDLFFNSSRGVYRVITENLNYRPTLFEQLNQGD